MNKAQLIESIAEKAEIPKTVAAKALNATLESITNELVEGSSVPLIGFGVFSTKSRAARTGRNPRTGEPMMIEESVVVNFKAGKALKEAVANTKTAEEV